ncbi:LOW QUALITY PROTEIN: proclotting enzyme [Daphnia magna]|uniref:LOW QUALITY PROTEIN: proclotting enzyme n=1 Tax=Daphnia magna TaxID=35525 RepID=UPI001E1BD303|nr:LOW QUALITY PROTEIN: proclotting enzyme [Daphnia magna]
MCHIVRFTFLLTVLLCSCFSFAFVFQMRDVPFSQGESVSNGRRNARMVGADEATQNQYPFMLALMKRSDVLTDEYSLYCGASLISSTQILTAAHCVNDVETNRVLGPERFIVLLGMHFMNESMNDAQVTKRVIGVMVHEEFDSISHFNDIAILTMETPVVFTSTISPVCMPPIGSTDQYLNRIAIAQGWGRTQEKGKNSDFLRHVGIRIISNSLCRKSYMEKGKISDHMLCTWLSGKDACQNDSGGPLVIEAEHLECSWVQVGIVSFGRGCARRFPGVYTRLTSFLPWLKKHLKS